ncbi:unnamed protein product [Strongylus vulgaris]|uniref:Uncharacterized protein n=1 Tax=Strongylus vulgaris TaxID=40348 RepID=A0A3P7J4X6_STRVU|nr:unnamed protein product [Strongylus vulgaris]
MNELLGALAVPGDVLTPDVSHIERDVVAKSDHLGECPSVCACVWADKHPVGGYRLTRNTLAQRSPSHACLDAVVVFSSVLTDEPPRNPAADDGHRHTGCSPQRRPSSLSSTRVPLRYRFLYDQSITAIRNRFAMLSAIPIAPTPAMSPCDSEGIAAWITISGSVIL